ncbi:2-succinyl-6-hydroxy-2,4-cyclohexadiene-1-carboxylate synthase [Nostoc sp.]|uniref:2-succinyl-6-hydroxy-2, 4-cyclohexadiene-1-carboxylate synthase n=1 Tax=Nostoc sp. TaxID=1180 RepID=UPI002FFA56C1
MTLEKYKFNYYLNINVNKPLILFLHGFMGNMNEFAEAIELLSEDFSYLTVDLPGHGKTQVLGSDKYYKIEPTAQAIINLLDEFKIDKCHLIAYSMGGRLALYLTLHFPERFIKVVLESASPGLATEAERLERVKRDAQIARKLSRSIIQTDFAAFLSNWYSQPIFGYIRNHPKFEKLLEHRLQNDLIELTKSLKFMGTGNQPSLWERLKDNTTPLLLLAGENDEKFKYINTEIANICKIAELKIISNTAHNIHFENPVQFVQNIREFFKN